MAAIQRLPVSYDTQRMRKSAYPKLPLPVALHRLGLWGTSVDERNDYDRDDLVTQDLKEQEDGRRAEVYQFIDEILDRFMFTSKMRCRSEQVWSWILHEAREAPFAKQVTWVLYDKLGARHSPYVHALESIIIHRGYERRTRMNGEIDGGLQLYGQNGPINGSNYIWDQPMTVWIITPEEFQATYRLPEFINTHPARLVGGGLLHGTTYEIQQASYNFEQFLIDFEIRQREMNLLTGSPIRFPIRLDGYTEIDPAAPNATHDLIRIKGYTGMNLWANTVRVTHLNGQGHSPWIRVIVHPMEDPAAGFNLQMGMNPGVSYSNTLRRHTCFTHHRTAFNALLPTARNFRNVPITDQHAAEMGIQRHLKHGNQTRRRRMRDLEWVMTDSDHRDVTSDEEDGVSLFSRGAGPEANAADTTDDDSSDNDDDDHPDAGGNPDENNDGSDQGRAIGILIDQVDCGYEAEDESTKSGARRSRKRRTSAVETSTPKIPRVC